jgi:DNA-binding NarL/FixJ family response regulator
MARGKRAFGASAAGAPTATETPIERDNVTGVTGKAYNAGSGRVLVRRRAVAVAQHFREFEGLSIRQIADRLGCSPATVKAHVYDPTGEKAMAVKARYAGGCRGWEADT